MINTLFLILIIIIHLLFYKKALIKVKKEKIFYNNTNSLLVHLFGIYVWGDALVICPFFIVVSLGLLFIQNIYITLLIYALYMFFRQFFEVNYWLLQQFSMKKEYRPPDKGWEYLQTDELHIIYQLLNFYKVVLWAGIIILTLIILIK